MSKIYEENIDKARTIVDGMTANLGLVAPYGVTQAQLDEIASLAAETERLNVELDAMRKQVSAKTAVARAKLDALKDAVRAVKLVAKTNFEQPEWARLGIVDKR